MNHERFHDDPCSLLSQLPQDNYKVRKVRHTGTCSLCASTPVAKILVRVLKVAGALVHITLGSTQSRSHPHTRKACKQGPKGVEQDTQVHERVLLWTQHVIQQLGLPRPFSTDTEASYQRTISLNQSFLQNCDVIDLVTSPCTLQCHHQHWHCRTATKKII